MYWLTIGWWKYLLGMRISKYLKPNGLKFYDRETELWFFQVMWCRGKGHPKGVVWYNVNGYEPDMTCNYCGDDLS